MIAARLAGGNLFFAFLWWGAFGSSSEPSVFLGGGLGGGVFGSTRSSSEHSDFF